MRRLRRFSTLLAALFLCHCDRPSPPVTVRLTDLYKPEVVENPTPPAAVPVRLEWRFDGPPPSPAPDEHPATRGWEVLHGVSGLAIRQGRLAGRSTDDLPVLHFERTRDLDDDDLVHEVQVRMRASSGENVAVAFLGSPKLDRQVALDYARHFTWDSSSPIVAGDVMRTYTFRPVFHVVSSRARHVFLRPTDHEGASFEIESVRLVMRREYLASVASGLGWHGLGEVYRETLVARAPGALRFTLRLPARPRLDLAVGTVEEGPVTFRVQVRRKGGAAVDALVRTVTRAHRWDPAPVDLHRFADQEVELSLALTAEKVGTLGFWGTPTVRSLGTMPPPQTSAARPLERPQGVILVWIDTLRRDHLSAYGHRRPTSPLIDSLAAQGTLFRDCIGQASWTKVATPSLLTSLYPTAHGVKDFSDRLPGSATTLAEIYRGAGYATLSFSSILFTGQFTNLHQGFEEVHEGGSLPDRQSSKTAREYVDRLIGWLEAHREVPFFVFLHVLDPHDPYRPAPPYDTMWADPARRDEHERQNKELRKRIADPLLRHMGDAMPTRDDLVGAAIDPEAYVGYYRDWYDGSIRGMDAEIGRLVERLGNLGLDKRTLLVLSADHGEEFLEHGRTLHGQSVYGEMNNMPLIFWAPGQVRPGVAVEDTVQAVDVMPTLLEASRLPVPAGLHGRSLLPLLFPPAGTVRAAGWADRPAISEKAVTVQTGAPPPRDTESAAVVLNGWKLIHNTKRPAGRPEFELFDHRQDPLDLRDLAAQRPDVVERLRRELEAWRRTVASARLKPDSEAAAALSPEELERLRALGYVQ